MSLTTIFHSLEVPYLISVVGDSLFRVVLKELEEEHSIEHLQKLLIVYLLKDVIQILHLVLKQHQNNLRL